jgi:hypothetical protein
MRFAVVTAVSFFLLASSAFAQAWTTYVDRQRQFTINFPVRPVVSDTTYQTASGSMVPARVYAAERGTATFSVTIAEFSGTRVEGRSETQHAAASIAARGSADHDPYAYQDGLSGHHLTVRQPDGRVLRAAVYFFDNWLYIAESSDVIGAPSTAPFTHSLIITHKDGIQLNLDGYNAEEFNAFTGETRP